MNKLKLSIGETNKQAIYIGFFFSQLVEISSIHLAELNNEAEACARTFNELCCAAPQFYRFTYSPQNWTTVIAAIDKQQLSVQVAGLPIFNKVSDHTSTVRDNHNQLIQYEKLRIALFTNLQRCLLAHN